MLTQRARRFQTTSWSLILAASNDSETGPALADLCRRYWAPVNAFIRTRGYPHDEAEDLTQSFFARLLEKKYVAQAERSRGRFRTFLLTAVTHFLANEYDRRSAQKRGGDRKHVSIDDESSDGSREPATMLTPDELFDKRWAMTVVNDVTEAVRADARASGRGELFDKLLPLITAEAARQSYADIAAATGMTEGALRVAVHRERVRFREQLRRTIAATVAEPQQIDEEIRFLINALSVQGGEP